MTNSFLCFFLKVIKQYGKLLSITTNRLFFSTNGSIDSTNCPNEAVLVFETPQKSFIFEENCLNTEGCLTIHLKNKSLLQLVETSLQLVETIWQRHVEGAPLYHQTAKKV